MAINKNIINRALSDSFNEADKAYLNLLGSAEAKLLSVYKFTLQKVSDDIKKIYDKFGEYPSITELRKFNRLAAIEKQLADKITELQRKVQNIISSAIKTSLVDTYSITSSGINSAFGFNFTKLTLNEEGMKQFLSDTLWYDSLKNNSNILYTDIKRSLETVLRANAREEVLSGVIRGESYNSIKKALQERFNISATRAKTIAFTETHKAHTYAANQAIKESIEIANSFGIKTGKVWRHNGVGQPRLDHLEADGQTADFETGLFTVGGEQLEAPGLGTDPSNNINCHCSVAFEIMEDISDKSVKQLKESGADLTVIESNKNISAVKGILSEKEFNDNYRLIENIFPNINTTANVVLDINKSLKTNSPLTFKELSVLSNYTGNGFKTLNAFLNNNGRLNKEIMSYFVKNEEEVIKGLKAFAKNLEHVLLKLKPYKGESIRMLSEHFTPGWDSLKHSVGEVFSWKGFSSSGKQGSKYFFNYEDPSTKVYFIIKGKSGIDVSNYSIFPEEKEVLFRPNTRFKILRAYIKEVNGQSRRFIEVEELL